MRNFETLLHPSSTPLQKVEDDFLLQSGINIFVKREDLNDPEISGNKLHKLKYNLIKADKDGYNTLLTFGGAYSNHIYATAAAGKRFGFNTIGVIRGEEHLPLNSTLSFAKECGMKLIYMDRSTYRLKKSPEVISMLKKEFGKFYLIPEGGTNKLAVKGCSEIINSIQTEFDLICCACGTGGTLAGLISGLNGNKSALGFAVLKGAEFLIKEVKGLINLNGNNNLSNWNINLDYHLGGYAKTTNELLKFIQKFEETTGITLEPIYTGKMLFGIYDLIKKALIKEGLTIIAIHTGGLQGIAGFKERHIY